MSEFPPVWDDVVGQRELVTELSAAVADPHKLTHAWLLVGPPGSGRSTAAMSFAAALQCPEGGCGHCHSCGTVFGGNHADVELVSTSGLSILVQTARELAVKAHHSPAVGRFRIIIIEDADRLTQRAADALLKAIEEPVARTIWLLCAPSPEDVVVTIRSRCRIARLCTPTPEAVAELLVRRDGLDPEVAFFAAQASQSHIGIARMLASSQTARDRRRDILQAVTANRSIGESLRVAARIIAIAQEQATAQAEELDGQEQAQLYEAMGADPGARTQPPHVRSALSRLAKEQKTRATRRRRDVIDRALIDITSLYRDALRLHADPDFAVANVDLREEAEEIARLIGAEGCVQAIEEVALARERIAANGDPLLMVEALCVALEMPHFPRSSAS